MQHFPTRRAFLLSGAALVAGGVVLSRFAGASTIAGKPGEVTIALFSDAGEAEGTKLLAKVIKSEEEWMKQLSRRLAEGGAEELLAFVLPSLEPPERGR